VTRVLESRPAISPASVVGDLRVVSAAVLTLGVVIRLRAYLFARSLWLDEALLALNIIDRDIRHLIAQPLAGDQAAPVGFLMAVKVVTRVFGDGERALRLIPAAAGIALLLGLYAIARRYYDERTAIAVAVAAGLSRALIESSNEFKQYGLDALVTVVLIWAFHRATERDDDGRLVTLGILGIGALVFSHPACLTLTAIGVVLFALESSRKRWRQVGVLAGCGALWLLVFAFVYRLNIKPAANTSLLAFHAASFAPIGLSAATFGWYRTWIEAAFMYAVETSIWPLCLMLFVVGLWSLWRRQEPIAWMAIASLVTLWLVAALRLYPVHIRFLMFLYPLVLLVIAAGVAELLRDGRPAPIVVLLLVALYPAIATQAKQLWRPRGREETRDLVAIVLRSRQGADRVVVWQPTVASYLYYARRASAGAYDVLDGDLDRRLTPSEVASILPTAGTQRVWVLVSHMADGEYGSQNLETLRETLRSRSAIEQVWTRPDAELFLVRPSGPAVASK
jgi:uncharacterized membrane protein